mmetsp:Transcript_106758/g.281612  ORF Transcript_106758/g.281612 Transcript_106758/m.281612 type:complete len:301 (+) Transcript_106758:216-1118(+)
MDMQPKLSHTLGPLALSGSSGEVIVLASKGDSGSIVTVLALAARQILWYSYFASETCCGARFVAGSLGGIGTNGTAALSTTGFALCITAPCEGDDLTAKQGVATSEPALPGSVEALATRDTTGLGGHSTDGAAALSTTGFVICTAVFCVGEELTASQCAATAELHPSGSVAREFAAPATRDTTALGGTGTDGAVALSTAGCVLCVTGPWDAQELTAGRGAAESELPLAGSVARSVAAPSPRGTAGGSTAPPMGAPRPSLCGTGGDPTPARRPPHPRGMDAVPAMGGCSAHCGWATAAAAI